MRLTPANFVAPILRQCCRTLGFHNCPWTEYAFDIARHKTSIEVPIHAHEYVFRKASNLFNHRPMESDASTSLQCRNSMDLVSCDPLHLFNLCNWIVS